MQNIKKKLGPRKHPNLASVWELNSPRYGLLFRHMGSGGVLLVSEHVYNI